MMRRAKPDPWAEWGSTVDPLTGELDHRYGLRQMCDHGAAEFAKGACDAVLFRIMSNEREFVIQYMADAHPTVPFSVNYPGFGAKP